jgi:hypothetical protein
MQTGVKIYVRVNSETVKAKIPSDQRKFEQQRT